MLINFKAILNSSMSSESNLRYLIASLRNTKPPIKIITIKEFRKISSVAYYNCEFTNDLFVWNSWHRFSEFENLHTELLKNLKEVSKGNQPLPECPEKNYNIFSLNDSPEFTNKRKLKLEAYLNQLNKIFIVSTSEIFLKFSYNQKSQEIDLPKKILRKKFDESNNSNHPISEVYIEYISYFDNHALYHIRLIYKNEIGKNRKILLIKRFDEIYEFDQKLRNYLENNLKYKDLIGRIPIIPEKKNMIFIDHHDPKFLEQRRMAIENYFQKLVVVENLTHNIIVKDFFKIE